MSDDAFLYGTLFMTNAASLLLPGSNLTNLLVLGHEQVSGAEFASRMWPAFVTAVAVTICVVVLSRWRDLRVPSRRGNDDSPDVSRLAVMAVAVVAVVLVGTRTPALPGSCARGGNVGGGRGGRACVVATDR